jgi:prolipoprotein diacylglyceryl transferase
MQMTILLQQIIAWIHWDPSRFAFTIPLIERPVAWYGIFFAFGFILGFLLIIPIFKRKLLQTNQIFGRDIADWPLLINQFKKGMAGNTYPFNIIYGKLDSKAKESIKNFMLKQEPDQFLKNEILRILNISMKDAKLQVSRAQIETLFPKAIHTTKNLSLYLTDRVTWFVVGGTIIGARLGHVFLYDWPRYQDNPIDIIKIWEGGLASHGGTVGIMIALFIFVKMINKQFPEFTFIDLLDILAIPTAMAAIWIRVGNFFNQEILGHATTIPWAIVFQHPYDGSAVLPRHPVQLYEAAAYLITFIFLYVLWNKKAESLKKGTVIGLFMICVFGSRFFIEFLKAPQSLILDESFLSTGQYLSIPFIIMGFGFLFYPQDKKNKSLYSFNR